MTAVEWLLENLISEPYSETDFKHNSEFWDKAKEMEKQQIIDAYSVGYLTDFKLNSDYTTQTPEQYYNETFKSE